VKRNQFSKYTQKDVNFFKWRTQTPYITSRTHRLYDLIFRIQPEAVLVIGCGEGISLQYVSPLEYVGVDTSLARLQFASIRHRDHTFIQADGTCLPFSSGQFDLVFCKGTLHHLTKQETFLMIEEMSRVCKKGGWVAIIEPNAYNFYWFLLALIRKTERRILNCKGNAFLECFKRSGLAH